MVSISLTSYWMLIFYSGNVIDIHMLYLESFFNDQLHPTKTPQHAHISIQ